MAKGRSVTHQLGRLLSSGRHGHRPVRYHDAVTDPDALATRMVEEAAAAAGGAEPEASRQTPGPPAPPPLPTTLAALTALRDRHFIEAAYRVLLGRDPDPAGLANFLHQLRAGAVSKVDILGDLRYSPEGQQRGVEIEGLKRRYALRRLGRRRGIGWPFRWLLTLAKLPAVLRAVENNHAAIEAATLSAEEVRAGDVAALEMIAGSLRELRADNHALARRADLAEEGLRDLRDRFNLQVARLDEHAARLTANESASEIRHQRLSAANALLTRQLRELHASARSPLQAPPAARQEPHHQDAEDFDTFYLEFEDRLRGSREEIKRRQEVYLEQVATAAAGTVSRPIIDVGCGRGEWLEVLQEHGCVARGVDLNRVMVAENKQRGLDVIERDVLAYLGELPAGSVGMVTGFHIIEHLPFAILARLFDECLRVLRPGGCVVFETPNPENLVVGAFSFYYDPTHRHPLPPQLTEFLAQHRGFADVEILRLHPRSEEGWDRALLDKWFRAPTDYSVIGWKDGRGSAPR